MDNPNNNKLHYWMATAMIIYEKEEGVRSQQTLNMMISNTKKLISFPLLDNAKNAALSRLTEQQGITPEQFKDVVFLNFSYMGVMDQFELSGTEAPKKTRRSI